ncbi:MAG TPA: 1,6-anhydro-N-acetylmuramyl-L-alanine amidase AmpD [Pseudomonadales bacterium]|nr:1,6-anhydro-N-acetylmuramyl-L-alanine amidase AmpD [Pseudomonadales bacterium]
MPDISAVSGWLQGIRTLPSPNCNARPSIAAIDLLVIHNISLPPGQFGGDHIDALFCNELDCDADPYFETLRDLCVSAHFFINRDGQVTQYVSLDDRAWHAGVSQWDGREQCNDFSIGIELEGTDNTSYTDAQYAALTGLARVLMLLYPAITLNRIVGHSDIAPGRKTDPGEAFDWLRFRAALCENVAL